MSQSISKPAQHAVSLALKKAEGLNIFISVSIVDMGRNLVAFHRMDKAVLGTIEISQSKAYTSRTVNMKTSELGKLAQPGGPFYAIEITQNKPLVLFAGGCPLSIAGDIIGAIGVSGGSLEEDDTIADFVCSKIDKYCTAIS